VIESKIKEEASKGKKEPKAEALKRVDTATINLIASTLTDLADDSGWAFLGEIGNLLLKKQPDFDPRNFGFVKLAPLIKSIGKFEMDEREADKKGSKLVYVRMKP
jgi:Fe-S-cluster formation regulator IscX/YfhJ